MPFDVDKQRQRIHSLIATKWNKLDTGGHILDNCPLTATLGSGWRRPTCLAVISHFSKFHRTSQLAGTQRPRHH